MRDYRLADLLDLSIIQKMADAQYRAAGMPIGIVDAIDDSVLVGAGWQNICLNFHRAHPRSLQNCRESDNFIKKHLVQGEVCGYKCKNGLWDIGVPIVVAGRHLATLFLGQFFYEDEVPDRSFFASMGQAFDFDLGAYLAALDQVPVFSRERVDYLLEYNKALAGFIADLAGHALLKIDADEKIKRQADFLQVLMDAMPYPIFYKDRQGRYLGCNRAFERFYGMSREQIAGKTVYDISPRELADVYYQADEDLFAHPGAQTYETDVQSADGVHHEVIFHKATFEGSDGELAGLVGAVVDISERRRSEEERQKLQEQLAGARRMESIGRLAGGVAHDFNNMLGVILGNTELALASVDPARPLFTNLEEIRKAAEHSADLTRQLLAFARKQPVSPQVLDVNMTVDKLLTMLRRLLGEDIELAWMPGFDVWPVRIDPAQINQVLINLAANARDSINGVGKLSLSSKNIVADEAYCRATVGLTPGEYVMLTVSDNGRGMDPETRANIFEPFFTTKQQGKGVGLGLATVYGIVKQNHGAIYVYSEPGAGSTFKICLPRHAAQAGESPSPAQAAAATPAGGSETVLLVEDEPMLLELTETMLTNIGYNVLTAATPDAAIRLAHDHCGGIHLLMTDVVMPEMNGRDLAKRLRSHCPRLKLLFMSGYTADVIAHHGVLDQGVHFLQKPFSLKDLAATIREALDSSQDAASLSR